MFKSLIYPIFIALTLGIFIQTASARPRIKRPKAKTEIVPELIYRQVQVGHRAGSVFYKETRSSDFVDQIYIGSKFIKTYDYKFTVLVEPAFYTERDQATNEEFEIQQAYAVAQFTDYLSLTTGRKIEFTGSGYFLNPSDLLNEDKNLIDPLQQRTGKNFTKFTFESDEFSLSMGYIRRLNNDFREGQGWLQFEAVLAGADLLINQTYSKKLKTTTGISLAKFFTDSLELHFDGRHETTQRKDAEHFNYNDFDVEDDSFFYVLGTRFVMSHKRTLVFEWIQNQSGLLKEELEAYHEVLVQRKIDFDNNATNEQIPDPYTQLVGRRFLALGIFDEETFKNWSMKLTGITSLNDQSSFVTTEVKYKPAPVYSIAYAPTFFVGKDSSEFGQQPAHTAHYFVVQGQF